MAEPLVATAVAIRCRNCNRIEFSAPWSYLAVVRLCARCENEGEV